MPLSSNQLHSCLFLLLELIIHDLWELNGAIKYPIKNYSERIISLPYLPADREMEFSLESDGSTGRHRGEGLVSESGPYCHGSVDSDLPSDIVCMSEPDSSMLVDRYVIEVPKAATPVVTASRRGVQWIPPLIYLYSGEQWDIAEGVSNHCDAVSYTHLTLPTILLV